MKVLRENLICDNELVNLANIFMSVSEDLSATFEYVATRECDYFAEEHKLEIKDPFAWEIDWDRGMQLMTTDVIDFLNQELSEELLEAIKIEPHPTELPKSGVDYSADYLPALVTIEPDRLLALWGDREINDGRNISGFIRTADDRYWTTVKVLHELIWEDLGESGVDNFFGYVAEDWELEECVSHPEIQAHYDSGEYDCECYTPEMG